MLFTLVRTELLLVVAFQVIRFDEGATMPDKKFEIPHYCFEEKDE